MKKLDRSAVTGPSVSSAEVVAGCLGCFYILVWLLTISGTCFLVWAAVHFALKFW